MRHGYREPDGVRFSAMTNAQPNIHEFSSQRLTLRYAEWGDVAKPLLVLVHGALDQKRSWDWVAAAFADRYHVIAPDLRGHGESDWVSDGDYGVLDYVYDLASLIDHLGADTLTLVGHSLGGNICLRYTGLFPDRIEELVAIEGLGRSPKMIAEFLAKPIDDRLREWIEDRRKRSDREPRIIKDTDEAIARMGAAHKHLRDDQIEHLAKTGVAENKDGTVSWAYDPAILGRSPSDLTNEDFFALLGEITCPTWLVYGAKSWASNPEQDGRIKHFNNNPALTEYEDAGHWLHHDRFDEFMRDLNKFLDA